MNNNSPISPIFFSVALFLCVGFFLTGNTHAEAIKARQWKITADKLTRYENPPSVIAEGNVVLEKVEKVTKQKKLKHTGWSDLLEESPAADTPSTEKNKTVTTSQVITTIKAQWMVYDMDLGTVKARGDVYIKVGPDLLTAEEATVNLNRETGTFSNASIIRQYKDMHFEGKVIEKTGDLTYHFEDGWLITCKLKNGEAPPWSFGAAEADITDGGYAFLKHATFRVKNIPILYSPIMILPAKRSRQTGFLFPSVSLSDRDGFGTEFPFFINLSPNSDITLYPRYLSDRGFMSGIEFRYVLDQDSKGTFMGNFLNDDLSDREDPANADYYREGNYTHTNQNRYWLRGKVDQDIGDWTSRLDLDVVSDRDYLTEFNSGLTGFNVSDERFSDIFGRGFEERTKDRRRNTLRTLRSWGNGTSLQVDLLGINDLRVRKTSPTPLWKLPEVKYRGLLPVYDTGVDFSWKTDYVNFWRDRGVGAHRFDIHPRLSMAVPLTDYLETVVGAGFRETYYSINSDGPKEWKGSDSESRFLADFDTEIGTTLMRDFAVNWGEATSLTHTFRPYVNYFYINDTDQNELPQFDAVDRIGDRNLIIYGMNNFFTLNGMRHGKEFDRDYGYIKIRQGYDLRNSSSDEPLTPVNIRMAYYPVKDLSLIYRTDIDIYGDGFLSHIVEGNYSNSRGDFVAIDYRDSEAFVDKLVDSNDKSDTHRKKLDSLKFATSIGLLYNLRAGYSIERSLDDSKTVQEIFNLIYQPSCWSVEFTSDRTPGDQTYSVMFRLANIGSPFGLGF